MAIFAVLDNFQFVEKKLNANPEDFLVGGDGRALKAPGAIQFAKSHVDTGVARLGRHRLERRYGSGAVILAHSALVDQVLYV
jgi:hypothetical protein